MGGSKYKVGSFVKSRYRKRYRAMVLDVEQRRGCGDILVLLLVRDSIGQPLRKRIIARLNEHWCEACEPIETSSINPDWMILEQPHKGRDSTAP